MQERHLGKSGLKVSILGLGCNNFGARIDLEASRRVVDRALELGITFLDTADIYGADGASETCLGQILGARRRNIVVATKFGGTMPGAANAVKSASRRHIMNAVEASLARLKTDWIDLYQLHFPDADTPIDETLRALDDLVRQGKVRYIGCSNLQAWQVVEAQWTSRQLGLNAFVASQNEYSLLARGVERELLPALAACGMGFVPYFPLGGGALTGKYRPGAMPADARLSKSRALAERFLGDQNLAMIAELEKFAGARGHGPAELAIAWLLARPAVTSVITGATRPEQIEANVRSIDWTLDPDEVRQVDELTRRSLVAGADPR